MSQKMYGVMTDYQSRTAFVVPEILAADKATLAQYFAENKELELYRGLVDEILRTKEHVLSSEMEKLDGDDRRGGTDAGAGILHHQQCGSDLPGDRG